MSLSVTDLYQTPWRPGRLGRLLDRIIDDLIRPPRTRPPVPDSLSSCRRRIRLPSAEWPAGRPATSRARAALPGEQQRLHIRLIPRGAFIAAVRSGVTAWLAGICGAPRHAQVGRIIEQLGTMFCAEPPAAVVVHGTPTRRRPGAGGELRRGARDPRRGRVTVVRPRHARGDQQVRHRRARRPALCPTPPPRAPCTTGPRAPTTSACSPPTYRADRLPALIPGI